MSIKYEKETNRKIENSQLDFVVYEPIRRSNNENDEKEIDKLLKTKKFCGLYNRGNTCYLNALIQTLFMTPEFRENILSWKFNQNLHGKKEDSIPFQLQRLFARLQMKFRENETTEDLTRSFQWTNNQLMEQHDIQELCRVLFEAIENSFIEIEENFINDIYSGDTVSIVKCLDCGYKSEKKDRFLDISLPVRNEFDKVYNSSLEMALLNMLKEEKLEEDNKYKCDVCNKKVDALKLMKFLKLPKILFLQLNRFEYDFLTDSRKKLYDRFTFPKILNLNNFMKDYDEIKSIYTHEILKELEARDKIDSFEESTRKKEEYLKDGENIYELFAIVVHTGTPRGGHYFSIIKNFEDGSWYKFDDAHVYEMENIDIAKTFSDGNMNMNNCETGYIIMYRKFEGIQKEINFNGAIIQPWLMKDLEEENEVIKIEEMKQIERMNTLQLKFIFNDKIINIFEKKQSKIKDLKNQVIAYYSLEDFKPENIRLRNVHNLTYKFLEAFDDEEKSLQEYNFNSNKTYSLELKKDNEEFEVYNSYIIILNICIWDDYYLNSQFDEKDLIIKKLKIDKKISSNKIKDYLFDNLDLDPNKEIFIFKKIDYAHSNYTICEIDLNNLESESITKEQSNPNLDKINSNNDCNEKSNGNGNGFVNVSNNINNSPLGFLVENSKIFIEYKNDNWEYGRLKNENKLHNKYQKFSNFIKFFDERLANMTISFNVPIKQEKKVKITVGSYKFNQNIEIKPNKTLKELKNVLSEYLKIEEDKFIMKKNSHNGLELKNLSETIDKISSGTLKIYLEYGCPQKENELKMNLFLCELDLTFFLLFPYKITEMGSFNVDLEKIYTVKDLKKFFIRELDTKKNFNFTNENFVVIREYLNERPTTIYNEEQQLKDLVFTKNKKVFIQEIKTMKELKNFDNTDIQLTVREWDCENWKVSEPLEIHLRKKTTCFQLADILKEYYTNIKSENLCVYKVPNSMNIYMDDILKYKFENLFEKSDFNVESYPLFINADGAMLLVSDSTRKARKPTEEEKRLFCRPKLNNFTSKTSVSSNTSLTSTSIKSFNSKNEKLNEKKFRVKEKALKITVKKNDNVDSRDTKGNCNSSNELVNLNKDNYKDNLISNGFNNVEFDVKNGNRTKKNLNCDISAIYNIDVNKSD